MEVIIKNQKNMDMDSTEFVAGASDNEIKNAMNTLEVVFPESYKSFLSDFGGGDADGEIIFGITGNEEDDTVIATQTERTSGLPKSLVLIGYWNDTLICLDTSKMKNGECPVVEVNCDYSEVEVLQ